jgi:hypothetical protein
VPSWKKVIISGSDAALNSLNVTSGVTGSLLGTSSYSLSASYANNGGVTRIVAGSGIILEPSEGKGIVTITSIGSIITGSFTNTSSFSFNHNLNTRTPIITVFDSNYNQIIPTNIELVNTASALITFSSPESGFAIGSTGGTAGNTAEGAIKANYISSSSFGGTPLSSSVSFDISYADNNYIVNVTGYDARIWTIRDKIASGFTVNTNSSDPLLGDTYWMTTPFT